MTEREAAELRERVRHLDQECQGIHDSFEQADERAEKLWAENANLREENQKLAEDRDYWLTVAKSESVKNDYLARHKAELQVEAAELRKIVGKLKDALVEADSCLSLIRHRGVVEWGRGIPGIMEVDQILGRMRKAQRQEKR